MSTYFYTTTVRSGADAKVQLDETPSLVTIRNLVNANKIEWVHGMPIASGLFTEAATGVTRKIKSLGVHVSDTVVILGQLEGINSTEEEGHALSVESVSPPKKKESTIFSEDKNDW